MEKTKRLKLSDTRVDKILSASRRAVQIPKKQLESNHYDLSTMVSSVQEIPSNKLFAKIHYESQRKT